MESSSVMTNAGSVLVPGDDLLYEVVDGQVVELAPMGAYEIRIASVLTMYLETFARQHQLGRTVQGMLFDLTATVQRKRRVPRTEAWGVVPNLVVEVVSPTDGVDDVVDKVAEYFRAGVECVWVSLPSREQVYVYESPTQVRILTRDDELHGEPVLPQFRLPLTALFEEAEEAE